MRVLVFILFFFFRSEGLGTRKRKVRGRWIPWSLGLLTDWGTEKLGCQRGSRKYNYLSLEPQRTHWAVLWRGEKHREVRATNTQITDPTNGHPCTLFFSLWQRGRNTWLLCYVSDQHTRETAIPVAPASQYLSPSLHNGHDPFAVNVSLGKL